MQQNNPFTFGPYRLDTAIQLLWDKETNVALTPKRVSFIAVFFAAFGAPDFP